MKGPSRALPRPAGGTHGSRPSLSYRNASVDCGEQNLRRWASESLRPLWQEAGAAVRPSRLWIRREAGPLAPVFPSSGRRAESVACRRVTKGVTTTADAGELAQTLSDASLQVSHPKLLEQTTQRTLDTEEVTSSMLVSPTRITARQSPVPPPRSRASWRFGSHARQTARQSRSCCS